MRPSLRLIVLICALAGAASLGACDDIEGKPAAGRSGERQLVLQPLFQLREGGDTLLARPEWISVDAAGRYVISDVSDRNAKVFDPAGKPVRLIGRAGQGPGEFAALMTAQAFGDSVAAYDFVGGRLSIFGPDGRLARTLPLGGRGRPAPFTMRVVDDSLFLLVSAVPGASGDLISLARADGSVRSMFFRQAEHVGGDPQLASRLFVMADGAGGRVFVAVSGRDSVWVFDYDGRRLATGPADPVRPLVPTKTLLAKNGGRPRRSDGGFVVDGNRIIGNVVALDSGSVALQVVTYDGRTGVDPVEGGTLLVAAPGSGNGLRVLSRWEGAGGLLGRDRQGRPLVLRYTSPEADAYEVLRGTLAPLPDGR
jgi:hypothetical protein